MPRKTAVAPAPSPRLNHVLFRGEGPFYRQPWFGAVAVVVVLAGALLWTYRADFFPGGQARFTAAYGEGRFHEAAEIALGLAAENPSAANLRLVGVAHAEIAVHASSTAAAEAAVGTALQAALAAERAGRSEVATEILLGYVYGLKGDLSAASDRYHRALAIDPENADATAGLAAVIDAQGKERTAEDLFEKALKAEPQNPRTRVLYARALYGNQKFDAAAKVARAASAASLRIHAAEASRLAAASYVAIGELGDARPLADRAYALMPHWPKVVELQGELLLKEVLGPSQKRLPRDETLAAARAFADEAIARSPILATPHLLAFKVAFLQGDKLAAEAHASRFRALVGDDATVSDEARTLAIQYLNAIASTRATTQRQ